MGQKSYEYFKQSTVFRIWDTWVHFPAYHKKCSKCKKMNHFTAQCKYVIHIVEAAPEYKLVINVKIDNDRVSVKKVEVNVVMLMLLILIV